MPHRQTTDLLAPMLVPLAGMISGILAGTAGVGLWTGLSLILASCGLYLLLIHLTRNPVKSFTRNKYHYAWIMILFAGIGTITYDLNRPWQTEHPDKFIYARGKVLDVAQSTTGDRATIAISTLWDDKGMPVNVDNMTLLVRSDAMTARPDDEVELPLKMQPIVDSENYFTSGYASAMNRKGIYYNTRCEGSEIKVTGHKMTPHGAALLARDNIEAFIEKTPLHKDTQNFLITILLGDRAYLDSSTRDLFSDAGISHILALSGMHVAIIAGIIMWLLFPINFFGMYRYRLLISTLLLLGYAFLTGWAPSTVRATLMAMAIMICLFLERKNSAWNALLLATAIILLFSPSALFDVGLQLSFLCVASLIFFVNPLNPITGQGHRSLYNVCRAILATLTATLGTWCVVAWYFGIVPVAFLPANLITLPLLPAYIVTAIVYLAATMCGIHLTWLATLLDLGPVCLKNMLTWLSGEGGSALNFSPSPVAVCLWLLFAASLAILLNSKKTRIKKLLCVMAGCAFLLSVAPAVNAAEEEAFIIRKGNGGVSVLSRMNRKDTILQMPRQQVTGCTIAHKYIVIGDCTVEHMTTDPAMTCDILVIAGGIREELPEILERIHPDRIVIHPSVRKVRETRLMSAADSLAIPCHSIRLHGAFRYDSQRVKTLPQR